MVRAGRRDGRLKRGDVAWGPPRVSRRKAVWGWNVLRLGEPALRLSSPTCSGPISCPGLPPTPCTARPVWGYAIATASLVVALTAPVLGAIADAGGPDGELVGDAASPGHVFYDRLQPVLIEGGFDAFAEASCRPYYAARMVGPRKPWVLAFSALYVVGAAGRIRTCPETSGAYARYAQGWFAQSNNIHPHTPLAKAEANLEAVDAAPTSEDPAECVADKGYHSRAVLRALNDSPWKTRIAAPKQTGFSRWHGDGARSPTTVRGSSPGSPARPSSCAPRSSSAALPTTSIVAACDEPGCAGERMCTSDTCSTSPATIYRY